MNLLNIELPIFTIGRSNSNFFVLSEGNISRNHAKLIQCSLNSFILEDLDSKHGTFVNDVRISRKIIDIEDKIRFGNKEFILKKQLETAFPQTDNKSLTNIVKKTPLDFTIEFMVLKDVYDQYPILRKNCRNLDKMIRTGSIILSSVIGLSTVIATGGAAAIGIGSAAAIGMSASTSALSLLSSAGLSMLIPSLTSSLISTEEKLELIDKEFKQKYRCPNQACDDPFGNREWSVLAKQKTCKQCKAIWVN